jgi:Family of unknown function (DUF5906)
MPFNYETIPALATYINRIDAHELNFKRFMIRKYNNENNYYRERCLITIKPDFSITCTDPQFAPTSEELSAIQTALQRIDFPTATHATRGAFKTLVQRLGNSEHVFAFHDRVHEDIIMAQQRVETNDGKKYFPWSMWSDGEWRRMEPDEKLPFWKPDIPNKVGQRIMVHEGAKTASFVHELVNNPEHAAALEAHPWRDDLIKYEHWGMIGGALAPHRTDYQELIRQNPSEVIGVCDNDWPGKDALKTVSRCYGHALKGVMFDERWRNTWDLADPMPDSLFDEGQWIGPSLRSLMVLATWATERVPTGEGKKTMVVTRNEFNQEWVHIVTPEVFIHKDWPSRIFTIKEFNHMVRPYSDAEDTARLVKMHSANLGVELSYSPAVKPGLHNDGTGRYMNTHEPSAIKAIKGDPAPFLEYMNHLVVIDDDRTELLRWCATLIAQPDIKMRYGVLLVSEPQGVGKTTLAEKILRPLLGEWNVSSPSETEVVDQNFNYWAAHKRLTIINEIYAGHSAKAYNKLKSTITDDPIRVRKLYTAPYDLKNWIHIFACSNSLRALQLSSDDRRWFVPKITLDKRTPDYWTELNHWLTKLNGLGIIKWWATEWLKTNKPVAAGVDAPMSQAKRDMIEEGYSQGQTLVAQFLDMASAKAVADPPTFDSHAFILDVDLVKLITNHLHEGRPSDRLEKPATIRRLAKDHGWHVGAEHARVAEWGMRSHHAHVISLDPAVANTSPSELLRERKRPVDVAALAQLWITVTPNA